jgi:glucuronoarabinoxylan endo-1,4-beta-xylanase
MRMMFVMMQTGRLKGVWVLARVVLGAGILQSLASPPQVRAQVTDEAVIYLDSIQQVIRGFGAANIRPWRPDMTTNEIQKAFGIGPGQIGFTILRLRVPHQTSEFGLNVPAAWAAYSMGVTIIASPWTPPAWMKTSNNIVGGRLYDTSYASYAAHLKSFADYMSSNGVPLYAVSVQNEPDVQVTYESCDWNAQEMLTFARDYAPSVGTRIIVPESFNFNPTIANAILNDSIAVSHVAIIGGHIYGGGLRPYPLAASKGKELWMTEHLDLDTSWAAVLATGKEINDCMNAGMNAYLWWYIVRFYGPISEDGSVSKRGYVMSHFARFVRPDYVRVWATAPPLRPVYVSAYKGDSRIVIVAVHTGSSSLEQTFRIESLDGGTALFTPYVTSGTKNCQQEGDITAANGSLTVTLDAMSVTTFVSSSTPSSVGGSAAPQTVGLFQNYPNPFNPATVIRYQLPQSGRVTLKVFDVLGQEVATLVDEVQDAGLKAVRFDAGGLSSGMYIYQMLMNGFAVSRKMQYIR